MRFLRSLADYENPRSLGSRLRARRRGGLQRLIAAIHAEKGAVRIIDLGGRARYWQNFPSGWLAAHNVNITVLNREAGADAPNITHVQGDACATSFVDGAFDLVHSNSVIEHVGVVNMPAFARESRRLAPCYYMQTPYFWFPVEPHFIMPFFHWLPDTLRAWVLQRVGLGHYKRASSPAAAKAALDGARLLTYRQVRQLFPDAHISFEWLGLPKSLIAVR